MTRRWLYGLLLWLCAATAWPAETLPPKPAQYFNDYAKVVSPQVAASLNQQLEDFEKQTSNQVVVAIFPKMDSDSALEDYTHRVTESWKVGQSGKNNGAVLFVFVQDHSARIEVNYGLEAVLPDALCNRIIEDELLPHFKNNDYGAGLQAGITAIMQATRGEYKGNGHTVAGNIQANLGAMFQVGFVILILILGFIRSRSLGGTVYQQGGRRSYGGGWFLGGFGGGGFGGGGFGGGGGRGGFSGGGGMGGGGGASGHW